MKYGKVKQIKLRAKESKKRCSSEFLSVLDRDIEKAIVKACEHTSKVTLKPEDLYNGKTI